MLAASGIIVKIIGALFKIPIGGILKPEGMANFSIAYNIYALLFVLSTAGVPVAVSKIISHAHAVGRGWEARRIYSVSRNFFAAVGGIGSIVMYVWAPDFASFMSAAGSAPAIRAVAPAVFLVSLSAVSRGYYQGLSDMYPTAKSQVYEALGKLIVGFGAAWFLNKNGFGPSVCAAGAVLGVSVGALLSTAYLAAVNFAHRGKEEKPPLAIPRSAKNIIKELVRLSVPITAGAAVISLTNVIDSALVMRLLGESGLATGESMWLYGAYNYACNLFNLPSAVISTLGVSLIPKISAAHARRDLDVLSATSNTAVKVALLFAFPAAAGLLVLALPVMNILYGASVDAEAVHVSAVLLKYLTPAIPPLAVVTVTNAIHQACGNVRLPVLSMLCGAAVKLASNYFFVSIPQFNIKGAAISTVLCYTVIAVINCSAFKRINVRMKIISIFIKSGIPAFATGAAAYCTYFVVLHGEFPIIGTCAAVIAGVLAWAVCAVFIRAIDEEDEKMLFKGVKISKFLKIH